MSIQPKSVFVQALVLAIVFLHTGPASANMQTADAYFDSGNKAFRQNDFHSALDHYGNALAFGKDTPRVYYNMGLAHVRLGQFDQARSSFKVSADDDELAALSYYQLGAIAYQQGNSSKAIEWMVLARDNANSDKLRRQSTRVLEKLGIQESKFETEMIAGYGYDSNAFLSPDQPYLDYSGTTPTPVVPVPQSGSYVPIRVKGEYWAPMSRRYAFTADYRFGGEYHTDRELQNADFYDHRLKIGAERKLGDSGSRSRRVGLNAFYRLHGETNFDRDDGLDRFDDGQSIAGRYDYQSFGGEADLRYRTRARNRFEFEGGMEERDYEDIPTASSYDMTNIWIGGDYKIKFAEDSRLKLGYRHYVRDFDERRSRDIDGDASFANPTLEYRYNHMTAGFKHEFGSRLTAEVEYGYTIRTDQFEGYNDYNRHRIRLKSYIKLSERLDTMIRIDLRDQDYPNAFAFDEPGQPQKEYQEVDARLVLNFRLTDQLAVRGDVRYENVESTDPRGEFRRWRGALSVFWEYE